MFAPISMSMAQAVSEPEWRFWLEILLGGGVKFTLLSQIIAFLRREKKWLGTSSRGGVS
jgi:hypothetical protein